MIVLTIPRGKTVERGLCAALVANVGDVVLGLGFNEPTIEVFLANYVTEEQRAAVVTFVNGYTTAPATKTGAEVALAAQASLRVAAFKQLRADIEALSVTAPIKSVLQRLLRLIYLTAAAQSLSADDPDA